MVVSRTAAAKAQSPAALEAKKRECDLFWSSQKFRKIKASPSETDSTTTASAAISTATSTGSSSTPHLPVQPAVATQPTTPPAEQPLAAGQPAAAAAGDREPKEIMLDEVASNATFVPEDVWAPSHDRTLMADIDEYLNKIEKAEVTEADLRSMDELLKDAPKYSDKGEGVYEKAGRTGEFNVRDAVGQHFARVHKKGTEEYNKYNALESRAEKNFTAKSGQKQNSKMLRPEKSFNVNSAKSSRRKASP